MLKNFILFDVLNNGRYFDIYVYNIFEINYFLRFFKLYY